MLHIVFLFLRLWQHIWNHWSWLSGCNNDLCFAETEQKLNFKSPLQGFKYGTDISCSLC